MDYAVTNWLFAVFGESEFLLSFFKIVTYLGEWWSICIIIATLIAFKKTRKIGFFAGVSVLLAFSFNNCFLKMVIKRERPFVAFEEFGGACKVAGYVFPTGYSMASGHATASMALCASVFLQSKKSGLIFLWFPVLIGFSRMILCVHYLTDVLVGWFIGICFSIISFLLINFLKKLYLKGKGENYEKINFSNKEQA